MQAAERAAREELLRLVRLKTAPWGLPELQLDDVAAELMDIVEVLTPGRKCSDYEELQPLPGAGRGGVFTARYDGQECVLKEIRSMSSSGALKREVLHRKRLDHPLIVPVLAAFEEEDKGRAIAFLHMPKYACNLEQWCSSEHFTLAKTRLVLRDLLLAVAFVHSKNVIHGDLKPTNFLMDARDRPCLTDFETSQCTDSHRSRATTVLVGATPEFMAPEFPKLTAASDIYSLGCICDQILKRWAACWPLMEKECNALGVVAARMRSSRPEARPTAVVALDQITQAINVTETTVDMATPAHWQSRERGAIAVRRQVSAEDRGTWPKDVTTREQLTKALTQTMHSSCHSQFFAEHRVHITSIQRVENVQLWQRFCVARQALARKGLPPPISPPVRDVCPMLDSSTNEYWLWHGTRASNIEAIVREGLDEHLSRLEGLYGAGIYFSDEACKALQYSDQEGPRHLLFCRVVLGRPYYTKDALRSLRSLKNLKSYQDLVEKPDPEGHCSVIANPGAMKGHPHGQQFHREFVVFDGAAVYPEYIACVETGAS